MGNSGKYYKQQMKGSMERCVMQCAINKPHKGVCGVDTHTVQSSFSMSGPSQCTATNHAHRNRGRAACMGLRCESMRTYQKLLELWWQSIGSVGDVEVSYDQHQLQITETRRQPLAQPRPKQRTHHHS